MRGDGFIRCSDGQVRWGRYGAAGVLFVALEADATRVMLQKRSQFAHEGGTWSVAGGAIEPGETPEVAAIREASEEVGAVPDYRVLGEYVFAPADDWSYTTIIALVAGRFGYSANFETDDVDWFTAQEVDGMDLHAGFAAAWPHLRDVVTKVADDTWTDPAIT